MKSKKILSDMTVPYTSLSPTTSEADLRKTYSRHWTAMRAGLYLISVTSCCVGWELAEALADQFGWKSSSFAACYTFRSRLPSTGLVQYSNPALFPQRLGRCALD